MRTSAVLLGLLAALALSGVEPAESGDVPKKVKVKAPRGLCTSLAFSPDATRLAAGIRGEGAYVFDAVTGRRVFEVPTKIGYAGNVAFSPDGAELLVLVGGLQPAVECWNIQREEKVRTIEDVPWFGASMALAPDGRHLVLSGQVRPSRTEENGSIVVIGLEPGARRKELETKLRFSPGVTFSPDGTRLFIDGTPSSPSSIDPVRAYDTSSWTASKRYDGLMLSSLSLVPDGSRFYGTAQGTIAAYDTEGDAQGSALRWKAHGDHYPEVCCSHDGALVATWVYNNTGKKDPWLCIFDAATGRRLKRMKPDPKQPVVAVFSPLARRIAIGGESTVKIYDVSDLKTSE